MVRRQPAGHPRNSTRYKQSRAAFRRRQGRWAICALCGFEIDMALSGLTEMGPTVDHLVPLSDDPGLGQFFDPANWQISHRKCNSRRGRGALPRVEPKSPNA